MSKNFFLACLVAITVIFISLGNGAAQTAFRVGAWCLQQDPPAPQAIYQLPSGEWRVKGQERDRLINLGLNYFIACANLFAEQALVFMGDSLATAPAPKDYKTTLAWAPANADTATPYQVWDMIRMPGGPGNTHWQALVNTGYDSMYARYSGHTGVHSFFSGAERNLHLTPYHPWAEYISNSVHFNAPGIQALVQTCPFPTGLLDALLNSVPSLDIFMHCTYPLTSYTPTSGPVFQDSVQFFANQFSEAATAIRAHQSGTPLYAIIQTHSGLLPPPNNRTYRAPSREEILCQINLALAYGAKGIVYYLYSRANYGGPYFEQGLLDNARNPTTQYSSVQTINTNYQGTGQSLVNIGSNFLPLSWQAAFSIHQNTNEPISSTYKLYDVTSKIPGGATDTEAETYVEVGVLQSGSTNHYMVVNRRCTSSETREITLTLQGNSNYAYRITDVYSGSTTTCYLGSSITTFPYTLVLGPGQGKLLKLESIGVWSSTISANTTWSGNYSINANVTVNNNVTLTVSPGAMIQFGSAKSLTINGKLVADSNDPNNRITFTGASSTPGFWSGITINPGSFTNASTLRRCNVQYASTGIAITYTGNQNYVTVDRCRVSNNSTGGISVNGNAYASAFVHPIISNSHIHHNSSSGITVSNYAKPIGRLGARRYI
jgi:hypothetical protein